MSASMPTQATPPGEAQTPLADPALRRVLEDFVRRRVPAPDVDDVVQTVLCDALASRARPEGGEELRKWLLGIARHKVVDHHRRAVREPASELPDIEAGPDPIEARSLARWAEEQAASTDDAQKTLDWMAREGEGEKLESIAAEENVPAARVRQRVSRMRRWMKERWLAELAAVAVLAALAFIAWRLLRRPDERELPEARPDDPKGAPSLAPTAPPMLERARELRADALRKCEASAWQACLDGLDEAARLDPAGNAAPDVAAARERAGEALKSPPLAPSVPSVSPSSLDPAPKGPPTLTPPLPTSTAAPRPTGTAVPPSTTPTFTGKPTPKPQESSLDGFGKEAPRPVKPAPIGKTGGTPSKKGFSGDFPDSK
jgi:RNA polymerase sigma factor (sigma-70 family)